MQFKEDASQFTIFFTKLILFSSVIFFFLIHVCTLFHHQFQILVAIFTFWSSTPSTSHDLLMLFPSSAAFVFCCLHIPSTDVFLFISGSIPVNYSHTSSPNLALFHTASYFPTLLKLIMAYTIVCSHPQRSHMHTLENKFIFTLIR